MAVLRPHLALTNHGGIQVATADDGLAAHEDAEEPGEATCGCEGSQAGGTGCCSELQSCCA
jgi:hypothetical protein